MKTIASHGLKTKTCTRATPVDTLTVTVDAATIAATRSVVGSALVGAIIGRMLIEWFLFAVE